MPRQHRRSVSHRLRHLRDWGGEKPSLSIVNVTDRELFGMHAIKSKNPHPLPCAKDESPICARLTEMVTLEDKRVLQYVTTNYNEDDPTLPPAGFRGFYFDSRKEAGRQTADHDFRPSQPAITGSYQGRKPIGLWYLWSPDGRVVGATNFDDSTRFVECNES